MSLIPYPTFLKNLADVRDRIARACTATGRSADEVTLMAVTKTHAALAADYAARAGLDCVGENRVQEAAGKRPQAEAGRELHWALIGHLQSNKARLAVETFDSVQSADRPKILKALDRHAAELRGMGNPLPVLLQINAGDDPAKFGAACDSAHALLDTALDCAHLRVDGLMTIAPLDETQDMRAIARQCFAQLRKTRDRLETRYAIKLPQLSMGMTGDLEEAVAEGTTCIRVGTALFGVRP